MYIVEQHGNFIGGHKEILTDEKIEKNRLIIILIIIEITGLPPLSHISFFIIKS